MKNNLKCFISSSDVTNLPFIKDILAEYNLDTIDVYDISIGDSIQQVLKQKIRQSDFALFVITDSSKSNMIYEMGICEGIGKQYFIILEKNCKIPSHLDNQFVIRTEFLDTSFLKSVVEKILQVGVKKKRSNKSSLKRGDEIKPYTTDITEKLRSHIQQIGNLRAFGTTNELENVIKNIFQTINLSYVENQTNKNIGVDFALWNDEVGKLLGNPMIVEVKHGKISLDTFKTAEEQIKTYLGKTDARVALFLYLDRDGKRFKMKSSLYPLIISYDLEDFVTDLLTNSFEKLILAQRNKIAHGVD